MSEVPGCPRCGGVLPAASAAQVLDRCPSCGESLGAGPAPPVETLLDNRPGASLPVGAAPPEPPQQIGRFLVKGLLGQGGFGNVYRAYDPHLQREVALKVPNRPPATGEQREEFLREPRRASGLHHENIVQVFEACADESGCYIAIELVQGGSLRNWLDKHGLEPPRRAAERVEQLARALHFLHEKGIMHRDVKPENVLLTEDGKPKLADFGLARPFEAGQRPTQSTAGTIGYMAPEQQLDGKPGPASDEYSLGVVLYEMLTGVLPFCDPAVYAQFCQDQVDVPRFPKAKPPVPRDLETICLKCLSRQPGKRYASCAELADDLRRFLNGELIRARRPSVRERVVKWCKRRPVGTTLVSVLAALLILGGVAAGVYWDRYVRVKERYYANFITRYGVKEGVGRPLTREQARRRAVSYKFLVRGRRVLEMHIVNGTGNFVSEHRVYTPLPVEEERGRREVRYTYKYKDKGELSEETAYDRSGNVVWILQFATPTTAQYLNPQREALTTGGRRRAGKAARRGAETAFGLAQPRTRSGATHLHYTWTGQGLAEMLVYYNPAGERRPNDAGVWALRQKHDERGLVTEQVCLDEKDVPVLHTERKVATWRWQYDGQGNLVEEACFDARGRPAANKDGWHRLANRYDERGNLAEKAFFDTRGAAAANLNGPHKVVNRYDEKGNLVEERYFDTAGRPTTSKDGCHRTETAYDHRGIPTEQAYFNAAGEPTVHVEGCHRRVSKYDERGIATEQAYFDRDGRPALHRDGYHRAVARTDERGNQIEVVCFDRQNRPTAHKEGFHRAVSQYDERGNRVEQAYFGTDQKPTSIRDGHHRLTSKYDARDNRVEEAHFDAEGKPTTNKFGWHREENKYDEQGNQTEQAYFGPDGKPTVVKEGWHKIKVRFDDRNYATEHRYFGPDEMPTVDKTGSHVWATKHDARGNHVEDAHFDVKGEKCSCVDGYHRGKIRYDERDNPVEEAFFDTAGKKCSCKDDYHKVSRQFDLQGNLLEDRYFDSDGKECDCKDGFHKGVNKYDDRGNTVEQAFFGVGDKPVLYLESYHKLAIRHDDRGNPVEEAYFGTEGKPVVSQGLFHKVVRRYDDRGNASEEYCLDTAGKPTTNKDGYHRLLSKYDDRSNQTERAFFDTDGKPFAPKGGWHKVVFQYDDRSNLIEEAIFGTDSKPMLFPLGYAGYKVTRDPRGREVSFLYYGLKGEPVPTRVTVTHVAPDGAAARSGLQVGDVLLTYAGQPIPQMCTFFRLRESEGANDRPRPLVVLRNGKKLPLAVPPGTLGMVLADIGPNAKPPVGEPPD